MCPMEENVNKEIDEGFEDAEEDELESDALPALFNDPEEGTISPPEESDEDEEEEVCKCYGDLICTQCNLVCSIWVLIGLLHYVCRLPFIIFRKRRELLKMRMTRR